MITGAVHDRPITRLPLYKLNKLYLEQICERVDAAHIPFVGNMQVEVESTPACGFDRYTGEYYAERVVGARIEYRDTFGHWVVRLPINTWQASIDVALKSLKREVEKHLAATSRPRARSV